MAACLPLVACTTVDRASVTPAQGEYLDAVSVLGGYDQDKLETGSVLCQLWTDLIAEDRGLPTGLAVERSAVERKGASGPNTEAYANAANTYLCPGVRQDARVLYNSRDHSYVDDGGGDPPPEIGYDYQFGD
jgi:hypothetical protein